jgi:5,5'-dehydrodivanillate O-demethylase
MLPELKNERLTTVAPHTDMGELLRRYWHPISAASEFPVPQSKPVRLLGEDLVLYKDRSGNYGLIGRHCPHRGADMSYGVVEDCGIRCSYHGWAFDRQGACIERPYEDMTDESHHRRDRVRAVSYPVEEHFGLLWAYMGPAPAPLVPTWEPFTYPNGFVQIVFSLVPCNWLQCQENSIDPVHFEWLHSNWSQVQLGLDGIHPSYRRLDFERFDYGFYYHRMLAGEDISSDNWRILRLCILPNLFIPRSHFEWRVPVDDTTTLSVIWHYTRVPADREPYHQESIPAWWAPVFEENSSRLVTSHVLNQDFVAWLGQGAKADRTVEHLGRSDRGVVLLRKQLMADMDTVKAGGEPTGLVRDPGTNACITLPSDREEILAPALSRDEWLEALRFKAERSLNRDYFELVAGQPEEVRAQFEEAMGLDRATWDRYLASHPALVP